MEMGGSDWWSDWLSCDLKSRSVWQPQAFTSIVVPEVSLSSISSKVTQYQYCLYSLNLQVQQCGKIKIPDEFGNVLATIIYRFIMHSLGYL
jgi:hypothetical protein